MSDAPSYLPPYARATRGLPSPVTPAPARAADDPDDDADDLDREEDDHPLPARQPSAPVREGLPPTYRMRHEAHYVEALVGSRTPVSDAPPAPAAPSAPIAAVPTAPPPPSEADTLPPQASAPVTTAAPIPTSAVVPAVTSDGAVLAGLTASLEAIAASLDDLSRHGRPLRERVALDLARAEVTRARWVTDAAAVLRADPLPALDAVDLAAVCRSVAEAFAPEFRLGGGAAVLSVPAGAAPVFGDERLLQTAVGALLAAVRRLVEDNRGDASRITLTLGPRVEGATRTVDITQAAVRVPAQAYARFFDHGWGAHPAGATGAVLFGAAARIASAHGGSLAIHRLDHGGCRFELSLPAAG